MLLVPSQAGLGVPGLHGQGVVACRRQACQVVCAACVAALYSTSKVVCMLLRGCFVALRVCWLADLFGAECLGFVPTVW